MVQYPVQDGAGHLLIVKDIYPAGKFGIGIDNQRFTLVAFGNHFE